MSKTTDRVLKQIHDLMRRGKDGSGASEAEMETSLKLARQLMDKYNVEEAEINLDETPGSQVKEIVQQEAAKRRGQIELIDQLLVSGVQDLTDTRAFYRTTWEAGPRGGGEVQAVVFYGFPRDVAVAAAIFKELRLTMRTMARVRCGGSWSSAHTDYCKGFAMRVSRRAAQVKRESQAEAGCTAIVVHKSSALDEYKAQFLDLQPARKSRWGIRDAAAYAAGDLDGDRVSLNFREGLERPNEPDRKLL